MSLTSLPEPAQDCCSPRTVLRSINRAKPAAGKPQQRRPRRGTWTALPCIPVRSCTEACRIARTRMLIFVLRLGCVGIGRRRRAKLGHMGLRADAVCERRRLSLPCLRDRLERLVRQVPGHNGAIRLSASVHHRRASLHFSMRPARFAKGGRGISRLTYTVRPSMRRDPARRCRSIPPAGNRDRGSQNLLPHLLEAVQTYAPSVRSATRCVMPSGCRKRVVL